MAAQLIIKILSFAFSVLIIRRLGAETFGQYAAVLAFGAVFVFFADLGLSTYTVREVARLRERPDGTEQIQTLYANVRVLRLLLAMVAAVMIIGTAWLTQRPMEMIIGIALGTIGLLLYSVQGTAESVLAGFERLDLTAGARVTYQLTFVIGGAVALLLAAGYYGLIYANLLAILLMTTICWLGLRRINLRAGSLQIRMWPSLLRASIPFGVIAFTLGLSYKFDTILLNIFRGDTETGLYNSAYSLVFSVMLISNVFNTSLYPSLTRQSIRSPHTLDGIYERVLRIILAVAIPIAIGCSVLADQIIGFLFGGDYGQATFPLRILIWVVPFMFTTEFLGYVILIKGHEKRVARSIAVSTGVNIGLNILLIPTWGLLAASIMTVVTEAILLSQYVWMLRAHLRKMDWTLILMKPLLAALLMGVAVYFVRSWPIFASIPFAAAVYGSLLLLLGVFGMTELRLLLALRERPS